MHRQIIRTGLTHGGRHDLDDPERKRDLRNLVEHLAGTLIHRIAHTDIPSSIGLNWLWFGERGTGSPDPCRSSLSGDLEGRVVFVPGRSAFRVRTAGPLSRP